MQTMTSKQAWTLRFLLLGLFAAGSMMVLAEETEATHLRGGTFYALPTGNESQVRLQGQFYWRLGLFGGCTTRQVGETCDGSTFGFNINPGGGAPECTSGVGWLINVTVRNDGENWGGGKIIDTCDGMDGFLVTYPGSGLYTATWGQGFCCRISSNDGFGNRHVNHPDYSGVFQTTVDLLEWPYNSPPISAFPPVYICKKDAVCWIEIPNIDPDEDDVDMRWATPAEYGDPRFTVLGDPMCGACGSAPLAKIHRHNQTIEWDTTGATFFPDCPTTRTYYSTQIMLEDNDTSNPTPHEPPSTSTYTAKHHKVPVDFLVMLCEHIPDQPFWVMPPSPCGKFEKVLLGTTIVLRFEAKSNNPGRMITLYNLGLPPGATLEYVVNPGNPAVAQVTWTPSQSHTGSYLIVFGGYDDQGIGLKPCAVRLRVSMEPDADFTWRFTDTSPKDWTHDAVEFRDTTQWPPFLNSYTKTYLWEFYDLAGNLVDSQTEPTPRYTYHTIGVHKVCMKVFAQKGPALIKADLCKSVTVNNRPPVAAFTVGDPKDRTVQFIDLSSDRDGTVTTWAWEFPSGTPGTAAVQQLPLIEYPSKGTYTVELTVTDDRGAVDKTTQTVVVPNSVPVVAPIADIEVPAGSTVVVPISASDLDQEHLLLSMRNAPSAGTLVDDLDGTGLYTWKTTKSDIGRYRAVSAVASDLEDEGKWSFTITVFDPVRDSDGDGISDEADNCPTVPNVDQANADGGPQGDACAGMALESMADVQALADISVGPVPEPVTGTQDPDGDGVVDNSDDKRVLLDNCPGLSNPDQSDQDRDGKGDACDAAVVGRACDGCDPVTGTRPAAGLGGLPIGSTLAAAAAVALVTIALVLVLRKGR